MKHIIFLILILVSSNSFASLMEGLVVHYEFEENANDSSGNNYHGIEIGGVSYIQGVAGYAASFDGIDDYVDMGVTLGGYSAFSEFAWVRANTLKSGNNFVQSSNWYVSDTLGNDGGSDMAITNGYIKSWINQPDRTASSVLAGPYVVIGQWHLIGSTWDGSTHRLYFDGAEVTSGAYTGYMGESAKNSLVASKHYGAGLTDFFNGDVDELRIYNRALTQQEVEQLHAIPEPTTLFCVQRR